MRTVARLVPWVLFGIACSPTESPPMPPDGGGEYPGFVGYGEHAIDSHGRSGPITMPLDSKGGSLEIRVGPGDMPEVPGVCYQIDDVRDSEGGVWVPPADTHADWGPYCTTCAQRVSVGQGYGLFVFPNNGDSLPSASEVQIRVSLRACASGLPLDPSLGPIIPASVRVESRRTAAVSPQARGHVSLFFAFAEGTQFTSDAAEQAAIVQAAREDVASTFDVAALDVTMDGQATFSAGTGPIAWSDADRTPLDTLYQAAVKARTAKGGPEDSLLVIFAPCLLQKDALTGAPGQPDGMTAHLPSGDGLGGHAEGVFVKATGCGAGAGPTYWLDGAMLGKVLAHEVGHALGLYHTAEINGVEDHLDDTSPENLMNRAPLLAASKGLSPRQIRVLRGHPSVRYPGR